MSFLLIVVSFGPIQAEHKRNFKKNMAELSNEVRSLLSVVVRYGGYNDKSHTHCTQLVLLESHTHSLTERSTQVEEQLKAAEHEALVLPDHPNNPLLPQLQTSNKFAVMVRTQFNVPVNHHLVHI